MATHTTQSLLLCCQDGTIESSTLVDVRSRRDNALTTFKSSLASVSERSNEPLTEEDIDRLIENPDEDPY